MSMLQQHLLLKTHTASPPPDSPNSDEGKNGRFLPAPSVIRKIGSGHRTRRLASPASSVLDVPARRRHAAIVDPQTQVDDSTALGPQGQDREPALHTLQVSNVQSQRRHAAIASPHTRPEASTNEGLRKNATAMTYHGRTRRRSSPDALQAPPVDLFAPRRYATVFTPQPGPSWNSETEITSRKSHDEKEYPSSPGGKSFLQKADSQKHGSDDEISSLLTSLTKKPIPKNSTQQRSFFDHYKRTIPQTGSESPAKLSQEKDKRSSTS